MRTTIHSHRSATLVGALLLATLGALAFARSVDEVIPGQKLWGELGPTEDVTVIVRTVDGTVLDLSAKAWKGSALHPSLTLQDEGGHNVSLFAFTKVSKKGNQVQVKKLPLGAGAYRLTIAGESGTSGGFDLVTKAKLPTSIKGTATIGDPGGTASVFVDTLPGDVVQLRVKAAKKSGLAPLIEQIVDAEGIATPIGAAKQSPKIVLPDGGRQRFDVVGADESTGSFTYKLTIKRAKAPKERRDVADLNAQGSVTGRVVIEGDVTRDDAATAKAARSTSGPPDTDGDVISGEIIVAPAPGATLDDVLAGIDEEVPTLRTDVASEITPNGPWLVRVPSLSGTQDRRERRQTLTLARAFAAAPALAYAEPNRRVTAFKTPNDLRYAEQYDLGQMNLPKAWDIETGSSSVVIAILDTGIMPHPDLQPNQIAGYDFVGNSTSAMDGSGWDPDPTDSARDYHGTHVAGTAAAATSNGIGVSGVAWNCKILPVRVLGRDGGSDYDIAAGLRWAVGGSVSGVPDNPRPARVVNMSLGGPGSSTTLQLAVAYAASQGAVLVAAAGNSGSSVPSYPAAYGDVISVYALDANLYWASYSNWGPTISVGAPGGDMFRGLPGILSTWIDSTGAATYTQLQGTSMACPHVAGVAALLLSAVPSLTPAQVRNAIETTAVDLGPPGFDVDFGYGMVDAYQALRKVTAPPPAPPSLRVAPSTLEFGRLTDTRVISVQNEGNGTVTISGVTAETTDQGAWLSAQAVSSTVPTSITVTVDHDLLFDGTFDGEIVIDTSVGQARVPVRVTRITPPSLGLVRIKALDAEGRVLASTTTSKAKNWEYALADVPLGSYSIVAEADLDADLQLTGVDEFVGRWPLYDRPETLDVAVTDLDRVDIDVPLLRRDALYDFDGVGAGPIDGAVAARVFDASTGVAISGATVFVGNGGLGAQTDAGGRAVVAGSFSGAQTVSAVAAGYVTRSRVGCNAQYQAFGLEPLAMPETVRVTAEVSGLDATANEIALHVGTTHIAVPWEGGATQSVAIDIPRRRPVEAVGVIAYDAEPKPVAFALGSLAMPATGDVSIELTLAPPPTGARGRVVETDYPGLPFQTPAALVARVEVRLDRDQWAPIGSTTVVPLSASTVWWASLLNLVPPLDMRFEVAATDTAGRTSRRIYVGTTAAIDIDRPMTLPTPPTAQFPSGGLDVPRSGLALTHFAAGTENVFDATIRGDDGRPVWRLTAAGVAGPIPVPDLPQGGLDMGATYSWEIESRTIAGFEFAQYLEDDMRREATTHCTSAPATFRAQ